MTTLVANLPVYAKAFAAFAAFLGVAAATLADGSLTADEIGALASSAAGVLAVFGVTNRKAKDTNKPGD